MFSLQMDQSLALPSFTLSKQNTTQIAGSFCTAFRATLTFEHGAAQMRSIAMYVHKYRKNVVSCQRFIRAFNQANRARMKEMGKQWDQVARDIIGDDSGRMWMHRLLNQAKIDENGKAVNPANANQDLATFKESKLRLEIRRLRREFMDRYEQYKTDVRVFKAKVEMYSTMESMGLDAVEPSSLLHCVDTLLSSKCRVPRC
jgi:hypothetical protein